MKIYIKAIVISLVLAIAISGSFYFWKTGTDAGSKQSKINGIEQMERYGVPNFEAISLDGDQISLGKITNPIMIVHFWASWCGPCVEEIPSLVKLVDEMKGQVKVIAVSGDSSDEDVHNFLKSFPEMKHKDIHIIVDKSQSISRLYDVDRLPESFIANQKHQLIKKIIGSTNWHTADSVSYLKGQIKAGSDE
ncbi:MAG: hypothetical protein BroJett040_17600 [Oligoflexia bacterium]|nr:MAG: hypothetical protein BroJett040_17600 [Oligoflexia bacterium]